MILTGDAATARIAREDALALHAIEFDAGHRTLTVQADGTRVDDEEQTVDTGLPELDAVLDKSRAIVVRPGCRRYRLTFEDVACYAVHDESFHVPEDHEDFSTPLRTYTRSRFLTYLTRASFVDKVMEGPPTHFRVATLDDIVDVACYTPPDVTSVLLTASDLWLPTPQDL